MYRWTVKVIIRLMITNLQPYRCLMEVTRQFWRLWRGIFTGFLHIPPSVIVHFQVCFLMKILMSCLKAITYHHRTMSKHTILLNHNYRLQFATTCARTIALFFGTDRYNYTKLKNAESVIEADMPQTVNPLEDLSITLLVLKSTSLLSPKLLAKKAHSTIFTSLTSLGSINHVISWVESISWGHVVPSANSSSLMAGMILSVCASDCPLGDLAAIAE